MDEKCSNASQQRIIKTKKEFKSLNFVFYFIENRLNYL